jgi:hypothetical protein
MQRFVFYNSSGLDPKTAAAAKRTVKSLGATVVKATAGTMLLEASPAKLALVVKALPGWRYSIEAKSYRIPDRSPLQRARLNAAKQSG